MSERQALPHARTALERAIAAAEQADELAAQSGTDQAVAAAAARAQAWTGIADQLVYLAHEVVVDVTDGPRPGGLADRLARAAAEPGHV
jgi:hypothetical protein